MNHLNGASINKQKILIIKKKSLCVEGEGHIKDIERSVGNVREVADAHFSIYKLVQMECNTSTRIVWLYGIFDWTQGDS